jgi:hypothetical protein
MRQLSRWIAPAAEASAVLKLAGLKELGSLTAS